MFFLFQCAESALKSVLGGLNNTYFVGNAPMAHMVVDQKEDSSISSFKVLISCFSSFGKKCIVHYVFFKRIGFAQLLLESIRVQMF